jgi:hypothetical protein
MRTILLAGCAFLLANCTTPNMTAMNTGGTQQQASGAAQRDEEPPVPAVFRKPPPQSIRNWGGNAYGGMY